MPDFRLQNNFPIASVIDAAQRKAQLENQAQENANQSLIAGLQSIGQVGQSLYDTKKRVAQSLALGRQFDIPDDVAKTMDPSQILQVGAIKKGNVDMNMLLNMLHPGSGGTAPVVPTAAAPAPDQPGATAPRTPTNVPLSMGPKPEAVLASTAPTIPMPAHTEPAASMPFGGASTAPVSVPVPVPAPPLQPKTVNAATAKMAMAMRPVPVMTAADALGKGSVEKGTIIRDIPKSAKDSSDPGTQSKLEHQYTQTLEKNLSNRSGGLGLEDSKVNQAIHLRRLINQYYDPKTGQYNVPKAIYGEMVNGLATLVSPGGKPGIEVMHELQQKTAAGDLGGALAYLGFTDANGNVPTGSTQSVLKMLVDSVDRQGQQAEDNRQGYIDQLHGMAPSDLAQERIERLNKVKLGNSFNSFLQKAPDRQGQNAGGWDHSNEQRLQELLAKQASGTIKK